MERIVLDIIIYSFAFFGVIIFIREIVNCFNHSDSKNKIVIILNENEENVEGILRDLLNSTTINKFTNCIYIMQVSDKSVNANIIKKFSEHNEAIVIINKNELLNIVENS